MSLLQNSRAYCITQAVNRQIPASSSCSTELGAIIYPWLQFPPYGCVLLLPSTLWATLSCGRRSLLVPALSLNSSQIDAEKCLILRLTFVSSLSPKFWINLNAHIHHDSSQQPACLHTWSLIHGAAADCRMGNPWERLWACGLGDKVQFPCSCGEDIEGTLVTLILDPCLHLCKWKAGLKDSHHSSEPFPYPHCSHSSPLQCASWSSSLGHAICQKSDVVQVKMKLRSSVWNFGTFLEESIDWRGSALCLCAALLRQKATSSLLCTCVHRAKEKSFRCLLNPVLSCSGLASPGKLKVMWK